MRRDYSSSFMPDCPVCVDCGRRLDGLKYRAGAFQCWSCAMGEFVAEPEPSLKEKLDEAYGPRRSSHELQRKKAS